MSNRLKSLVLLWGLALLGIGSLAGLLFLFMAGGADWDSTLWLAVMVLSGAGGGGLVTIAAVQAMGRAPARPLRLPPAWALAGGFALALATGLGLWQGAWGGAFLPAICALVAATLAPLAVAAWLLQAGWAPADDVSRTRGLCALGMGATASVALALVLNTLVSGIILALVFGLAEPMLDVAGDLLSLLSGGLFEAGWEAAMLVLALVEVAVLVPLTEELVKPLALLPVLRRVPTARGALLLGVLAGAGFAAVENLLYVSLFSRQWGGVLAARSLGAALHPFGAGLMAVAWWRVVRGEPQAAPRWFQHYGLAGGAHAVWNGTSVVVGALAGAWLRGWEIDLLGVAGAALLVALLAVEGVGLLVALRALARRIAAPEPDATAAAPGLPTERAIAVWAVVCLVVLLPVGLGLLKALW